MCLIESRRGYKLCMDLVDPEETSLLERLSDRILLQHHSTSEEKHGDSEPPTSVYWVPEDETFV